MLKHKTGLILNSSHYFIIAIDHYGQEGIRGVIYHGSQSYGIQFNSLVSLIENINFILDELKCLRESVEVRKFRNADKPLQTTVSKTGFGEVRDGKLGTFQLFIQSRYHASWQGSFSWIEGGITNRFDSFLYFIIQMDQLLSNGKILPEYIESGCENANIQFCTAIRLLEQLEGLVCSSGYGGVEGVPITKMMPNRIFWAYYKRNKKATFIVKVLFDKNSTWQGNICWKESCDQISFRSFLEMLILMDSALDNDNEREFPDYHVNKI